MAKYLPSTSPQHPAFDISGPSIEFPGFNIPVCNRHGADKLASELNSLDNVRHALTCVLRDIKDMVAEGATTELVHLLPRMRSVLLYGVDSQVASLVEQSDEQVANIAYVAAWAEGKQILKGFGLQHAGETTQPLAIRADRERQAAVLLSRPVEAECHELITCIHTGKLVPKI